MNTSIHLVKNKLLSTTAVIFASALVSAPLATAAQMQIDPEGVEDQIERGYMNARSGDYGYVEADYEDGVVHLIGDVRSYLDKQRVAAMAGAMKGVTEVENDIDVSPSGLDDGEIRQSILSGLYANPLTERLDIGVSVENGFVSLSGTVESHAEKREAGEVASSTYGVLDVGNHLTVTTPAHANDADLERDILDRFAWDSWLSPDPIDVSVENGVVTLDGSVTSLWERDRAYDLSFIPGVKEVRIDTLGIGSTDSDSSIGDIVTRSDNNVVTAIEAEWRRSPWISQENLTVTYGGGVATLSGIVDSLSERREAEEEAQDVVGVEQVENLIQVSDIPVRSDDDIKAALKDAFERDPFLNESAVSATVFESRVYLTGTVEEEVDRQRAEDIAEQISGVREVRNTISVDDRFAMSDAALAERTRDAIRWDPRVEADELRISVDDGVVTLTGAVETERAVDAAVTSAFSSGAVDVIEMLTVSGSA